MIGKLKSLMQQSLFYGFGNFIIKGSGLILLPLYSDNLTKAEFGLVALYESAFLFLFMASGWGVKGGFTRWFNEMKSEEEERKLFFTSYTFNVFTSMLSVGITALFLLNLELFHHGDYKTIIQFFSISSLFKLLYDVPFIFLKLRQKAFKQTTYLTINVTLTILLTYYFLSVAKMGVKGVFIAQAIANTFTFISILPLIIKSSCPRFNVSYLKEMIHYGYPLAISNILTLVLTVSDRYILEAYYSLEAVGSFSVAIKVANLLQFLVVGSFVTSYTYQYYKSMHEEDGSRYHIKIFTYFVLMMVLAGMGIVFFGKEIIYVIMAGKKEYFDAIPVIPLLIVGLIFSGMRQVFVLPITKAKKTRLISVVMIATGVLNIGLNFMIIPRFGKEGAAFTTAISQLAAALWFLYKVKQIDGTRYEWRKVFTVFVIGFVFCSSFFFLPSVNWMVDIFIKIGLVILFLLMLYWSNFFEAIEKERISQAWAKWRNPGEMINNIKRFGK